MRKIDEIAAQQFGGDTLAVINHYVQNKMCLDDFVDDFTKEEAEHAFSLLVDAVADNYGGMDSLQTIVIFDNHLEELGVSEETVETASINPFKKGTINALIKLLLSIFVPLALYAIIRQFTDNTSWIFAVQTCLIGVFSINLATALLKLLKFRKLKKQYPKIKAIRDIAKAKEAD